MSPYSKAAKLRGKVISSKVAPIGEIFYSQKSPGSGAAKAGRQPQHLAVGRRAVVPAGQAGDTGVNEELGKKKRIWTMRS